MSYSGIGRLSTCPPTTGSQNPVKPDPCAIGYKVKIPIWGEDTVEVPVIQMTQDAFAQAIRTMPEHLPTIYAYSAPYIDKAIKEKVEPFINEFIEGTIRPEVEIQKEDVLAKVEAFANRTLITTTLIAAGLIIASGAGYVYLNKKGML